MKAYQDTVAILKNSFINTIKLYYSQCQLLFYASDDHKVEVYNDFKSTKVFG